MEKKEKRNHIITAILCAVFLIVAYVTANGQDKRICRIQDVTEGKPYVCKTPVYPLRFRPLNSTDTLFLTIIADSISHPIYSIMLYAYYTKGIDHPDKGIRIWFKDLTYQDFEPFEMNKEDRYIKYNIVGHSYANMHNKELFAIDVKSVVYCEDLRKKRYFMDFLDNYDK